MWRVSATCRCHRRKINNLKNSWLCEWPLSIEMWAGEGLKRDENVTWRRNDLGVANVVYLSSNLYLPPRKLSLGILCTFLLGAV